MVRSLMMLAVVGVILVGAGILHVTWNKESGSATVSFDKQRAKEAAAKIIDEAKSLEANLQGSKAQATK